MKYLSEIQKAKVVRMVNEIKDSKKAKKYKQWLLEGASIHWRTEFEFPSDHDMCVTILTCAIRDNELEIAEVLIEAGADVDSRTYEGYTPLMYARTVEAAELLLKNGANVNVIRKVGETALLILIDLENYYNRPLMQCGGKNNNSLIKLLLENGALVPDWKLEEVNHYASICGSEEISELLRRANQKYKDICGADGPDL